MKLDFERRGGEWNKIRRYSPVDWSKNVETIVNWSPFSSEEHLLQQVTLYLSLCRNVKVMHGVYYSALFFTYKLIIFFSC